MKIYREGQYIMKTCGIYEVTVMEDERGFNLFPYDQQLSDELEFSIQQVNQPFSIEPYTLRGLHFQEASYEQAKLSSA